MKERLPKQKIDKHTRSIWPVIKKEMKVLGETLTEWKQRINARINLLRNLRSFDYDAHVEADLIVNGSEEKVNELIDNEGLNIRVWHKQKEKPSVEDTLKHGL